MKIINATKKYLWVFVLSCLLIAQTVLPNGMVAFATTDVTPPVIDASSLTVTSTGTTIGNTVTISVKVTDDSSGVNDVYLYYYSPITKKYNLFETTYNPATGKYEYTMQITKDTESGAWKISSIYADDNLSNDSYMYNSKIESYSTPRTDLSAGNFEVTGTTADVTPPVIDASSVSATSTGTTVGNTVTISVKVTDDSSGVNDVYLYYYSPITKKHNSFETTYNSATGKYEYTMQITKDTESGVWKISSIYADDNLSNDSYMYNSKIESYSIPRVDLSAGNFEVTGTTADVTPPVIDASSVSATSTGTTVGDTVTISVKVTDDSSGVNDVYLYYYSPITKKYNSFETTYNPVTAKYEYTMRITEDTEFGTWKISSIYADDNLSNDSYMYNNKINSYYPSADLSAAYFEVTEDTNPIPKLAGVTTVAYSQNWSNKTITGDLYIAPGAVLTLYGSVTVTGNLYVLGALRSYVGLTIGGELRARNLTFGFSTLYNGTVNMFGSNSVNSIVVSDNVLNDMPLRIDNNPIRSFNGKISLQGATVPVVNAYVNDQQISLDYYGRFDLVDFDIDNKNSIDIKFVDTFGNEFIKTYDVIPSVSLGNGVLNGIPEISAKDIFIEKGSNIDLLNDISAKDYEDGDITSSVTVKETNFDASKVGNYYAIYQVTDSAGVSTTQQVNIKVTEPISNISIAKISDQVYTGDEIKPTVSITDGDKTLVEGTDYSVTYSNNVNVGTANILVKGLNNYTGETPVSFNITSKDISTLSSNSLSEQLYMGSAISPQITIVDGNKTLVEGTDYSVTYSNNINVGTSSVVIKGLNNYSGEIPLTFTINPKDILSFCPKDIPDQYYTGSAINPVFTIIDGNTTLVENKDYSLSYNNNVEIGKGSLTVRGLGNYTGEQTVYFNIIPINVNSVSLNYDKLSLKLGGTATLIASLSPFNATNKNVVWASSNENVATVDSSGLITAIGYGTSTITVTTVDGGKIATCNVTVEIPAVTVSYRTHVQDFGWQSYVSDGTMSGTSGQSKRLEAININVDGNSDLGITYSTHVQDIGWQGFVSDGALSGTQGQSKRLEAIKIKLTGADADLYDVYYCVHAESYGWLSWAKNGSAAGTEGLGLRLEAIKIRVVKKTDNFSFDTSYPFVSAYGNGSINYRTHVQNFGWQNYVGDGAMSGTSGQSLRLEGINIRLNTNLPSGSVLYSTHVQDIGWMSEVSDGALSGTQGQSKRLEAITIRLTGDVANQYDIYYRVHAQNVGWMGWAKNGERAGTAGFSYRLEGIQIVLVPKGGAAPGSTANAFIQG